MPKTAKNSQEANLNREIQLFSMEALELAKAVVDGPDVKEAQEKARALSGSVADFAAQAREMSDAYRTGAMKTLADARLDLAFVAAGGKGASSTRIAWYIKEKAEAGRTDN